LLIVFICTYTHVAENVNASLLSTHQKKLSWKQAGNLHLLAQMRQQKQNQTSSKTILAGGFNISTQQEK